MGCLVVHKDFISVGPQRSENEVASLATHDLADVLYATDWSNLYPQKRR
jgi:hypothetical protein